MGKSWRYESDGKGGLICARHTPVRWDLAIAASFPNLRPKPLARAIRQDMWRLLRNTRGLRPAVAVAPAPDGGLTVTAGGSLDAAAPSDHCAQKLETLLASPRHRARWIAYAGHAP